MSESHDSRPQSRSPAYPRHHHSTTGGTGTAVLMALLVVAAIVGIWLFSGKEDPPTPELEASPAVEESEATARPAPTVPPAGDADDPPPEAAEMERDLEPIEEQRQQEAEIAVPDAQAEPEEIARYEQRLRRRIQERRADARQGDLLTPNLVAHLRAIVQDVLAQSDGHEVLATLREENPGPMSLEINAPYPADNVATVPPVLLQRFPALPEGIQYRFVGCNLILLEADTDLVLDFATDCMW